VFDLIFFSNNMLDDLKKTGRYHIFIDGKHGIGETRAT
jgi:hypothetical protein